MMHMYYAAILGGISALYAGALVFDIWRLHNIKDGRTIMPLTEPKSFLMIKFIVAILGMAVGGGFLIYLTITGIIKGERMESSYFMGAIQGWMTFKWSLSWSFHLYRHHHF